MALTILVIDDDPDMRLTVSRWLEKSDYQPITAANGLEGLKLFHAQHPVLVILDVTMPTMDGWTVAARLREVSDVPIIMLTAKDEKANRLQGFELGADDYVLKPFLPEELMARVRAVLKRVPADARPSASTPIVCGAVMIDLTTRRVTRAGKVVRLSPTEFRLLTALATTRGVPQASRDLAVSVWGTADYNQLENVRTYIRYLREKLEDQPQDPKLILTERGFGYYLAG